MNTSPSIRAIAQAGFSLVELMISVAISLLLLAGLSAMLVNVSGANSEMAKANSQIENGRFAVQVLDSDLVLAGFWGKYVPQFDDLNFPMIPQDTPTAIPDPCLATSGWDFAYKNNLIGIPVESGQSAPGTCVLASKVLNTDYLVVRHAAPCVQGETNCDDEVAGKMYFQASLCANATYGKASAGSTTSITLAESNSINNTLTTNNAYKGMTIRTLSGAGANQTGTITAYDGATRVATVSFTTAVAVDTTYTIVESLIDTANFTLKARGVDCGTAAAAEKRKFVSNIYYIRSYAATAGDGIPTLVRSAFDPGTAVALSHQAAEPLVEGIERFAVEIGIDNKMSRCAVATVNDYTKAVIKIAPPPTCVVDTANALLNSLPNNRGDGAPDSFVRCTTAVPCTVAQLRDAVAVKLFMLVRNTEKSAGYIDTKTYCMASIPAGEECPTASIAGPFNDGYKRHAFTTSVRLTSVSGRRETP